LNEKVSKSEINNILKDLKNFGELNEKVKNIDNDLDRLIDNMKKQFQSIDNSINNLSLSTNNTLDEEGEEKDKIINNNNNDEIIKNDVINKKNNFIKQIWKLIKVLFSENLFSFYKKGSDSNGELYMYTPCSHVFHTECLEKWFEFKKECPNCRISMKEYLE